MHNGKLLFALSLTFLAGYFSHLLLVDNSNKANSSSSEQPTSTQPSAVSQKQPLTVNFGTPDGIRNSSANTSSANSASSTMDQQAPKNTHQFETENQTQESTPPTPFDGLLKQPGNPLGEKYKAYLANQSEKQDDWDMQMQGKITDFILSRPATTDIKINRINCHLNVCEIHLQEQKRFLLMATFGELLQEQWITSTATGQFHFNDNNGYMLLMRKQ